MPRVHGAMLLAGAGLLAIGCGTVEPSAPGTSATPSATAPAATPATVPGGSPTVAPTAIGGVPAEIRSAVKATRSTGSARVDFGVGFQGSPGVADGDTIIGSGRFASTEPPRAHLSMAGMSMEFQGFELVIDGDLYYMRGPAFEEWAPDDEWVLVDSTSDHPNAQALAAAVTDQSDPWSALEILLGSTGGLEVEAPGRIGGFPVRHLRLGVDLELALDRAPTSAREYLLYQIASFGDQGFDTTFHADVFIDAANHIRRVAYDVALPEVDGGGQIVLWYEFSGFGVPVELPEIAPDQIVDIEDVDLG